MSFYNDDHRDFALPQGGWEQETPFDQDSPYVGNVDLPVSALCLKVPETRGEELVVHRENAKDYVFLFESLDDAFDYAREAEKALDFTPEIGRVHLNDLHFRNARYKPALSGQIDLILRRF
jgi:hypothetical protein